MDAETNDLVSVEHNISISMGWNESFPIILSVNSFIVIDDTSFGGISITRIIKTRTSEPITTYMCLLGYESELNNKIMEYPTLTFDSIDNVDRMISSNGEHQSWISKTPIFVKTIDPLLMNNISGLLLQECLDIDPEKIIEILGEPKYFPISEPDDVLEQAPELRYIPSPILKQMVMNNRYMISFYQYMANTPNLQNKLSLKEYVNPAYHGTVLSNQSDDKIL